MGGNRYCCVAPCFCWREEGRNPKYQLLDHRSTEPPKNQVQVTSYEQRQHPKAEGSGVVLLEMGWEGGAGELGKAGEEKRAELK